jgi:hypothetical protein
VDRPPGDERDIVVFQVVRESACGECGEILDKGRLLRMLDDRPLCMSCADLDRLVFLPSGNTALTRRARKHSPLNAVVVRFSHSRGRYERQGLLVADDALTQAESECLADADARERARERAAVRRDDLDHAFVAEFAARLRERYPGCPAETCQAVAEHACLRYSGRVGRSAAAKRFEDEVLHLALRAHVRHVHTDYERRLGRGTTRDVARSAVASDVDRIVETWCTPATIGAPPSS